MARFIYVIIMRIGSIIYFVPCMKKYAQHIEEYTEEDCYALAQRMIAKVAKTARITTCVRGAVCLPREGGYIMYANHQGKWDALGIMSGHERPCRVLMDKKRSEMPLANEFIDLVRGKRLDKGNIRQQAQCLREVAEEVKDGHVYLIFPEGGYGKHQGNRMGKFYTGCFRAAYDARCPVVPVALIDSYRPFGENSLRHVETRVHFLEPIPYEAYKDMKPADLAALVRKRISDKVREVTGTVAEVNVPDDTAA